MRAIEIQCICTKLFMDKKETHCIGSLDFILELSLSNNTNVLFATASKPGSNETNTLSNLTQLFARSFILN